MLLPTPSSAVRTCLRAGSGSVTAADPARAGKVLWSLHSILVDPASRPEEARSAGRRMRRILETGKFSHRPGMIVPPFVLAPGAPPASRDFHERDDSISRRLAPPDAISHQQTPALPPGATPKAKWPPNPARPVPMAGALGERGRGLADIRIYKITS